MSNRLITRCKNNEKEAFNQLLSQYEDYLYKICFSYTRNKEDALDMMQEVYIKIFCGIKTFDEKRPILPWLKKVTINTLINHSRKNSVEEINLYQNNLLPDKNNIEEEVICNDTSNVINTLIAELPEAYRLSLTLRYNQEMSYEEIASVLKQPLGTVKSNIYRARSILHQKMEICQLLEV